MTSETIPDAPSLVARLDTDLITAQAIADHIAERFGLEDIAVSLSDTSGGRWQVAIHFRNEAEREPVRDAVAAAAGAEAAAALQFGSVEAADWVRESLAGLQPVEAGRFIVHGHTPLRTGTPDLRKRRVNLDTAAVIGGPLTAAVFDDTRPEPVEFLTAGERGWLDWLR